MSESTFSRGPVSCPGKELTVLILAPSGRDAALIESSLATRQIDSSTATSITELLELLTPEVRVGALLLAEEALTEKGLAGLTRSLRDQPAWSDLPVLLLGRGERPRESLNELLVRRSCVYLRRPLRPIYFLSMVDSAIEMRRRQYQVCTLIEELDELNRQLKIRAGQLRHLSNELAEAQERERRRLAGYVHDELQQILAGAKFHLDLAERRSGDSERLGSSISLVKDLLLEAMDASRTLAQELSPTPLRRSGLVAALRWLASQMKEYHGLEVAIDLEQEAEPDDHHLTTFLFRSAQELLQNVSKHSGDNRAELVLRRREGNTILSITDEGAGFDPWILEGSETPVTFGIFSIRERAELQGGRMEIQSVPGEGSSISVIVPTPPRETEEAVAIEPGHPFPSSRGKVAPGDEQLIRVIVVDDHAVLRSGIRMMLNDQEGTTVLGEYGNGREAVEAVDELQPDVILMDVQMPEMDGIEATRVIKQRHPDVRIIALSMFDDEDTSQRMYAAGAERFLTKSGGGTLLLDAIFTPPGEVASRQGGGDGSNQA